MDIVDGAKRVSPEDWKLGGLQIFSGAIGVTAAFFSVWAAVAVEGGVTIFAGLSLTGWGLLLAVVLVALAMAIDHFKGDAFAQWMERCYWGKLPSGRYTDPGTEKSDFSQLMAGA
jgi:hypothetical protein